MITVIEPTRSFFKIKWRELYEYRDLLFLLAKRDIAIVYKQTILGPLWFFIQPLITTLVFTIIFGRVAKISTDGIPHFVFYMSGMVGWNFFSSVLNASATSLTANSALLSKVYFPRLITPLSTIISNSVYYVLNLMIFVCVYAYYYFCVAPMNLSWTVLALPLVALYTALVGLAFGLWVAAVTTKYRDLRFALPFVIQMWMYATPIVYPASGVVDPLFRMVIWANPVSIAVELNRYMFTGISAVTWPVIALGLSVTTFLLLSGIFVFNREQRNFVDII